MSLFVNKIVLSCIMLIVGVSASIYAYQPSVKTIIVGITVAMATVSATMLICHIKHKRKER
jgi:hypothetical protein